MTVLDIVNFQIQFFFGKGIEFVVPVENLFKIPIMLEVGCGGDSDIIGDNALFALSIPRL